MELRYTGPHDGASVLLREAAGERYVEVPHNGKLEVSGDQAKSLLESGQWSKWTETTTKKEG